jgi:hypothetical protein
MDKQNGEKRKTSCQTQLICSARCLILHINNNTNQEKNNAAVTISAVMIVQGKII